MGHIRLGTLPKSRPWRQVLAELDSPQINASAVASAVANAAQAQLANLKGDPALTYCFWTLARVLSAARGPDFASGLTEAGISSEGITSGAALVARVAKAVEIGLRHRSAPTVFSRMAELALRETLSREVASRAQSLFGGSLDVVQSACREASAPAEFGRVARTFFANYLSRTLKLVTDKELGNRVGPGAAMASPEQALKFQSALDQHCRESAKIVEEYAGGWLSKNNWEQNRRISEESVSGFAAYAIEKLSMELQRGRE